MFCLSSSYFWSSCHRLAGCVSTTIFPSISCLLTQLGISYFICTFHSFSQHEKSDLMVFSSPEPQCLIFHSSSAKTNIKDILHSTVVSHFHIWAPLELLWKYHHPNNLSVNVLPVCSKIFLTNMLINPAHSPTNSIWNRNLAKLHDTEHQTK